MTRQEGFIEEDWEREYLKDSVLLQEQEWQMYDDWWRQECEKLDEEVKRLPAKITVIVPKEESIEEETV